MPILKHVVTMLFIATFDIVVLSSIQAQEIPRLRVEIANSNSLIQNGDRVAWLGGRLWEQMQDRGDLETLLSLRLAGQGVTFRNVAWSGDDVTGRARALFGTEEDGYKRRLTDLKAARPTVVFVAYGQSEALDSSFSLERFEKLLLRLIGDLKSANYRVVIIAPLRIPSGTRYPSDLNRSNLRIAEFHDALSRNAKQSGCAFVELPAIDATMTDDGLGLHAAGYAEIAKRWATVICGRNATTSQLPSEVVIRVDQPSVGDQAWQLAKTQSAGNGALWTWNEQSAGVDEASLEVPTPQGQLRINKRRIQIRGLATGRYQLTIDGVTMGEGTDREWAAGKDISGFGVDRQRLALQHSIMRRDQLFMYRYRPQNETYLLLFRKHEQGNNAPELEQFDQLVSSKDVEIGELARPIVHRWELRKIDSSN